MFKFFKLLRCLFFGHLTGPKESSFFKLEGYRISCCDRCGFVIGLEKLNK